MKRLRITVEGKSYDVEVELLDEGTASPIPQPRVPASSTRVSEPIAVPKPAAAPKPAAGGDGDVKSPLAAVVISIDVAVGDTVEEGQKVFTLEAMKMNTLVSSPQAGKVEAIHVSVGSSVEEGQSLITIA
ncbi:biotin/lipoyl-containing protein [Rubellicoccus peritrichatus]|uniref:Biotin/lipoyl-containing protein n=1 Tax=Rubellicoccus peritrichatus TaxID=3080537 RepID=A0AAQ3LDP0_9BACT|nr:biotin/lipoyl-containing protein [Puniceicoccus sp. CR14]WOO40204.1 biotin/lipoyl-containing protein [Puniceicoccus sp. CR14]